jgi:hypothetical protein
VGIVVLPKIRYKEEKTSLRPSRLSGEQLPKFQKFDAFMPNMDNISILITFQKLPLRTYSLAEAYSQSAISGLKDKSKYAITN